MSLEMLRLDKMSKIFGGLVALKEVDLTLDKGEILGLIGPNGAGKTTLFNCIAGYYLPSSGTITFNGRDVTTTPPYNMCALGLSRTWQNIRLFNAMTVLQNIQVGFHCRTRSGLVEITLGTKQWRDEERRTREGATGLAALMGLEKKLSELSRNLSYGDQRRVEIARALASSPELLLLDEPCAGMLPGEKVAMVTLVNRLNKEMDKTVILVEHDMRVAMTVARRIVVLDHGEKLAEGTPKEVQANERVVEAYLGRPGERVGAHA